MKNITLAVDEEVLSEVRKYAAAQGTTVNALVRDALRRLADRVTDQQQSWDDLFRLSDEAKAEVGPITWKRDDLYER